MTHAPNHLVLKYFGWGKKSTGKHALCWVRTQNFIIFGAREQICPPTSKLRHSGTEIGLYPLRELHPWISSMVVPCEPWSSKWHCIHVHLTRSVAHIHSQETVPVRQQHMAQQSEIWACIFWEPALQGLLVVMLNMSIRKCICKLHACSLHMCNFLFYMCN